MAKRSARAEVFLDLPYDPNYENLLLAYIAAIYAFGMIPRVALEIPGGRRRLDRIFDLIQRCRYSIHDLSRVQLDRRKPRTPRFNMPFELGIAVALDKIGPFPHCWFVMEAVPHRLSKSLSDLNGTDPYIHGATIDGVFHAIANAFVRKRRQPSVAQMKAIYRQIRKHLLIIQRHTGATSVFAANVFKEIGVVASTAASALVK